MAAEWGDLGLLNCCTLLLSEGSGDLKKSHPRQLAS